MPANRVFSRLLVLEILFCLTTVHFLVCVVHGKGIFQRKVVESIVVCRLSSRRQLHRSGKSEARAPIGATHNSSCFQANFKKESQN
jgi:hypothetical protein